MFNSTGGFFIFFFRNVFGNRHVLQTLLMKFSILRQSRGTRQAERKASEFHRRGNERPTERGNVPSVNRPILRSSSLLFSPISCKQHILLPRVGWRYTDKLFKLNLKSLFPKGYTVHRFGREKHHRLKFIIRLLNVMEYPVCESVSSTSDCLLTN